MIKSSPCDTPIEKAVQCASENVAGNERKELKIINSAYMIEVYMVARILLMQKNGMEVSEA